MVCILAKGLRNHPRTMTISLHWLLLNLSDASYSDNGLLSPRPRRMGQRFNVKAASPSTNNWSAARLWRRRVSQVEE
jgi:hypothetical protein